MPISYLYIILKYEYGLTGSQQYFDCCRLLISKYAFLLGFFCT